jgi:predicted GNAT family N-acyltransferase
MVEAVGLVVARCAVDELLALRAEVLRPGLPLEQARFAGDLDAGTVHFAARRGSRVVGCATLMGSAFEGEPARQLRGMAVAGSEQGRGVGAAMLSAIDALARGEPPRLLWCNARVSAIGFYARHGWSVVSEEFDIPGVGLHRRMTKR